MKDFVRNNSLFFNDEVLFYLRLEAKRMVNGTDATVTLDQIANGIVRNELTTAYPEWVLLWEEMEEAKAAAIKSYRAIEQKACQGAEPVHERSRAA